MKSLFKSIICSVLVLFAMPSFAQTEQMTIHFKNGDKVVYPVTDIEEISYSVIDTPEPVKEVEVGDYYYSDGTWSSGKEAPLADKTCIGIVFCKGLCPEAEDDCEYKLKDGVTPLDEVHGYVVAINNAAESAAWGSWEAVSSFQDGEPWSAQNYITRHLKYDPTLLGDKQQARGIYTMRINSYGEVYEAKVLRSCGIQDWDNQVLEIIRKMPRWTPTINYYGKGEYRESVWTIPIFFKRNGNLIAHTAESHLEVGVPICYLNEQGDTIIPYGKYKFCQTDTIRHIGFVYENRQNARIVCIDNQGKELFYVYKYDNGPDYIREGLFRIMDEDGWIGFADSLGNVVIKPQFKFATSFENGKAQATTSGDAINDGEHSFWKSDEWQLIDHKGDKMIKYVAIRNGTSLKGLQITIFGKQREISQEISYSYPPDIEFANNLDVWVNLQDVSFDGKDDILVNLGQYSNQMIQYYDCFVWDETKGQYCKDESFRQIENPQINNEKRCVFSSSRISAASYSYKRFEFIEGHFIETAVLTQTFRASKQPPLFTEKQYVKGRGWVTLHKDVPVDKINRDWLSIIMK